MDYGRLVLRLVVASIAINLSSSLDAQQPSPAFEVATIKESKLLSEGGSMGMPPGRFVARNVPLNALVLFAYSFKSYQLSTPDDWVKTIRYEVEAKTSGIVRPADIRLMMQSLLADRFKLSLHSETREVRGYRLMASAKLGPGLRRSTLDCSLDPQPQPCTTGRMTFSPATSEIRDFGMSVPRLVELLSGFVQAPIVDETQLSGRFDVNMRWATDLTAVELPSIFTATQEQLGLKMEAQKVSTQVFVIDHVERPTPD